MVVLISHGFATMNVVRALPAWSSTMVLPLSVMSGVWVGSQLLQFMFTVSGAGQMASGMEALQALRELMAWHVLQTSQA